MREELAANHLIALIIELAAQLNHIAINGSRVGGLLADFFSQGKGRVAVGGCLLKMLQHIRKNPLRLSIVQIIHLFSPPIHLCSVPV